VTVTGASNWGYSNNYGAGGGGSPSNAAGAGGNGSAGIAILKYLGGQRGTGGSVSTVGSFTVHTFTGDGTYIA
jgi:hypothetical protein